MNIFEHLGRELIAHQEQPLTAFAILLAGPPLVATTMLLQTFDRTLSQPR